MIKNLLHLNFKTFLPLGFLLIFMLMIMIVSAGVGFLHLNSTSNQIINLKVQDIITNNLLGEMKESSVNRATLLLEMTHSNNAFKQDTLFQEINEFSNTFSSANKKLLNQNLDNDQKSLLMRQTVIDKYNIQLEQKAYDLMVQKQYNMSKMLLINSNIEYRYTNILNLEQISNDLLQKSNEKIAHLNEKQDKLIKGIIISAISSLLICILLTFIIVRTQKQNNLKLEKLANTDLLTSLPNRAHLITKIEETMSSNSDSTFVIAFLDIDYFKSINDSYGHDIGDEVLKLFANTINELILDGDILSRFGGDEFVLFLKGLNTRKQAISFISNLSKKLNTSFNIEGNEIFISSSIGVNIYQQNKNVHDVKTLLNRADNAMYSAKDAGRNCFHLFSKKTYENMQRENAISHALHTIIKNKNEDKELYINYQPILDISDHKMTGCEALLRWKTKSGTIIPTEEFIGIAEKTNLIDEINQLVILDACEQQSKWQLQGGTDIRININLSGSKHNFCGLLTKFNTEIEKRKLSPDLFGIELTERTILEVSDDTILKLNSFRSQGMLISIDDFGTGYSSLSYLKKLPITTIKIDKSFVSGLPYDNDDKELVKTIITLGHSLNLNIIAEGVENDLQLKFLLDHGCDYAQGYYFYRPLNINHFEKLKIAA